MHPEILRQMDDKHLIRTLEAQPSLTPTEQELLNRLTQWVSFIDTLGEKSLEDIIQEVADYREFMTGDTATTFIKQLNELQELYT